MNIDRPTSRLQINPHRGEECRKWGVGGVTAIKLYLYHTDINMSITLTWPLLCELIHYRYNCNDITLLTNKGKAVGHIICYTAGGGSEETGDRDRWRINSVSGRTTEPEKSSPEIKMLFENTGCQSSSRSTLWREVYGDMHAHTKDKSIVYCLITV